MGIKVFSEPWTERDFFEMVEADYAHYYVAEEAGEIIGYCGLRNMAGEGEITNVAVAPLFRRKGTGVPFGGRCGHRRCN